MTARGYFICFNLWYANSDAAADVLWSLVRICFLNVTLVIFPAFFVRLVILCIKFGFSASLLFSGKTPRKTSVFSLLEVSVIWKSSGLFYIFCENIHNLLQSWRGETSDSHQAMQKILNYSIWGISTGKMTQSDALHSSALENTFYHITFMSRKCWKHWWKKISIQCTLWELSSKHRSAAKASIFILIFSYKSPSEIQQDWN